MHYSFDNLLLFKDGIQKIELSVLRKLISLTLHVFIVNNIFLLSQKISRLGRTIYVHVMAAMSLSQSPT